ncbi:hypothetical protein [Agrococcus carbonis]|uniref:YtxH domain-containing protein n=1 Tax=Agrococcus carbonis TaxID=684552 RepID=A0A1H1P279_9MICO|nr:hypothetical protein [Agrococcus carbonis]SDS05331.1 hypothetical protein SAMN04489719_1430 [Agrococcus carbonis]
MRGRILFVVGLGAGYVLGAKAGRQRYEQIASAADKVWNSPAVTKQRHEVQHFVETKAPKLVESATDAASDAIDKVTKRKGPRSAGPASRGSA